MQGKLEPAAGEGRGQGQEKILMSGSRGRLAAGGVSGPVTEHSCCSVERSLVRCVRGRQERGSQGILDK